MTPAPKSLVVSLHDVSPRTRPDCERIIAALRALGVRQCSLLVIPDHHHRGHFLADPAFCQWLCDLFDCGHEVVIHGYFHQRTRRPAESALAKITTRIYTADEGEFYDIPGEKAAALLQKARAEFRSLGIDPAGFIAPAWLLSAPAEAALRHAGLAYTTRLGSVTDLKTGRLFASQSLVWSVRSAWRRAVSVAWNAWLFRTLKNNPLLRLSIHPVDVRHPEIWSQIREILARALGEREPLTYQRWIEKPRDSPF